MQRDHRQDRRSINGEEQHDHETDGRELSGIGALLRGVPHVAANRCFSAQRQLESTRKTFFELQLAGLPGPADCLFDLVDQRIVFALA